MRRALFASLSILFMGAIVQTRADDDPIGAKLAKAKEKYDADIEKFRMAVMK